ncbi:hypothetical protein BD626DRAFT_448777 [Schizophyllum amplum]|uniref:Uncharacterized protein n=1 Tax=Schizophyllum amplum TaxID=97359 RepID=A0A550CZT2_9AGAR|nr:hypothetical protein BD626DRAFT_448777 [Auriculariopsis ampla]
MRQSTAANRTSIYPNAAPANTATQMATLLEKKKEFDGTAALERSSAFMRQQIEDIAEDCDIMGSGSETLGRVTSQWPKMFEILALFLSQSGQDPEIQDLSQVDGQRLVRLPLDQLHQEVPNPPSEGSSAS